MDAVGTIKALNTVTVRPQVDGKLLSSTSRKARTSRRATCWPRSTLLFIKRNSIRRSPKRRRTKRSSQNSKIDLDRYERLAATAAINKQQADTQRALVAQNTALVQADQAAIDNAQAMLGYTTITAPIDGRTGIRMVDEGNYVRSATPIHQLW